MKRKAIISYGTGYKHKQFKFTLIGDNGEVVGRSSEFYTRKAKCINTLKKYFPKFKIVDTTKK
jgi:uncharacterized protein YegP (UPF0339 family)